MNNNTDIVFVLQGLNETHRTDRHIYFAFALVSYLFTIFVNITLIVTIFLEKMFHEPMFLYLCNLCVNGLYGASCFYPKLLHDLLSDVPVISYNGCITQIFVVYFYVFYEFSTLTVMAYDRYVAICKPLHYHSIMTPRTATRLLMLAYGLSVVEAVVGIVLTVRLPLCGNHLPMLYCTNWGVVKLSCVDTTINNLYGFVLIVSHIGQVLLIIVSYVRIVRAALRSRDDYKKFMQTCLPHLVTLVYFIMALVFDSLNSRFGSKARSLRPLRNIMAAEFLVVPPLINPIIYGINLHQIRRRVVRMFTRKVHVLGLNETQTDRHIYFAFALVSYLFTIFVNLTLIVTIFLEKMFHEPMYLFLCNLCVNGLYGASSFYPKLLHDLLSDVPVISYNGCVAQLFVVYSYVFYEFSTLTVMAYDRYVAVCKPLHYHSIMTHRTATRLLMLACGLSLLETAIGTVFTTRLPLCGSHLQKLYCTNWEVVKLSCVDTTINEIYAITLIISHICQVLLIVVSYVRIVRAALRSRDDRRKFMQTCLPHLVTLVYFIMALVFDALNTRFGSKARSLRPLRNIMAAEFLVVPPLINPIIYGINLHQIRRRVARMFTRKVHVQH